jgi:CheY-like chemotaxis protein/HPt (histidine-containing phosphotransfer) domain-containing protein
MGARAGRCSLRFAVRDTGIGIDPSVRETLFAAFTQGDTSFTRRFGGTGLGLAICRRLVEMMGGQIGVASDPGRGSEFWFTVSLEAPEPAASGAGQGRVETGATAAAAPARAPGLSESEQRELFVRVYGSGPVLLAEDNALNQIVGKAVLEGAGLGVEIAGDGAEALQALAAHPVGHFKAVFMDMHMPVMDGLEATRCLRTMPQGRGLPVIALTAAALSEDRERCLAAGMDEHIAKPLDPRDLLEAMMAVAMAATGNGRAAPPAVAALPPPAPGDSLPQVHGFDLQPLLERLQNNRRMVWRLLEEFVEREGTTADEIRRLVAEQRMEEARFRTHALVGSAIAVGATLVARTAAGLESALRAGVASPAMVQSVGEALHLNMAAVNRALQARSEAPPDRSAH